MLTRQVKLDKITDLSQSTSQVRRRNRSCCSRRCRSEQSDQFGGHVGVRCVQLRSAFWLTVWMVAVLGGLSPVSSTLAQSTSAPSMELRPGVGRSGVGFYSLDQWGLLRSTTVNRTSQDREPLLVFSSRHSEGVQFARRVWVPANSRRNSFTPIRFTRLPDGTGIEVQATLIDDGSGRETLLQPQPDIGALNLREPSYDTAVMSGSNDATAQLSAAVREAARLSSTSAFVSDDDAPAIASAWSAVDTLVISRPQPQLDPAQIEAIRQWVIGGGRLWINLERVDPEFARILLPRNWNVTVLGEASFTEYRIEGGSGPNRVGADDPRRVQVDYPHRMVRVTAPDMEVIHTVNGYPASMRQRIGHGQLLVTTLEAAGWLEHAGEQGHALGDLLWITRHGESLTSPGDAGEAGESDMQPVLQSMARDQIGYTVLGRGPVLVVLGLFTLALLIGGLALTQRGGLAHLGWIAPALAVVAAGVILALGLVRQSVDPLTLATAQWIEVADDGPYARVDSLVSVYTPPFAGAGQDVRFGGVDEVAWPDLSAHGGGTVRLLWTDGRSWTYPNLPLREGAVQTARRRSVERLDRPVAATIQLEADRLAGRIDTGDLGMIEDAVLVTPTGKLPLTLTGEGDFTAPVSDPLAAGQFFRAGVLGQREMARQAVYRQLMARSGFPRSPMLLGWSTGLTEGVELSGQPERRGTALVAIPVRIDRPTAGQRVTVPDVFLTMAPFSDPTRRYSGAPVYDTRNGEWVTPIQQAQTVLMQFELPASVRNLEIDHATIRFDLEAPGRPYTVVTYDGQIREVAQGNSPMGSHVVEVAGDEVPSVLENGVVVVGLRIEDPADPTTAEPWSLTRLDVAVAGIVTPNPEAESQP